MIQPLNWIIGLSIIGVIGYIVYLRSTIAFMKMEKLQKDNDNEIAKAKQSAYNTDLQQLVDEHNQELPGRIKRDTE